MRYMSSFISDKEANPYHPLSPDFLTSRKKYHKIRHYKGFDKEAKGKKNWESLNIIRVKNN